MFFSSSNNFLISPFKTLVEEEKTFYCAFGICFAHSNARLDDGKAINTFKKSSFKGFLTGDALHSTTTRSYRLSPNVLQARKGLVTREEIPFSTLLVWMEAKDMCDPETLKQQSLVISLIRIINCDVNLIELKLT